MHQRSNLVAGIFLGLSLVVLSLAPPACSLNAEGELFAGGDVPGSGPSSSGGPGSTGASSASGGGGAGTTGSGGAGTAGEGGSAGEGGGGTGGMGGMGGAGGAGGVVMGKGCGDGKLDPGEECDDKNKIDGDGCDSCDVVCTSGGIEDPATHHCYFIGGSPVGWDTAKILCEATPGYYLAALATVPEIDFIKLSPLADVWIGGLKVNNAWTWLTNEDWTYVDKMPPWRLNEPMGSADCVELGSTVDGNDAGTLNDSGCSNMKPYLCERNPPVAP